MLSQTNTVENVINSQGYNYSNIKTKILWHFIWAMKEAVIALKNY